MLILVLLFDNLVIILVSLCVPDGIGSGVKDISLDVLKFIYGDLNMKKIDQLKTACRKEVSFTLVL